MKNPIFTIMLLFSFQGYAQEDLGQSQQFNSQRGGVTLHQGAPLEVSIGTSDNRSIDGEFLRLIVDERADIPYIFKIIESHERTAYTRYYADKVWFKGSYVSFRLDIDERVFKARISLANINVENMDRPSYVAIGEWFDFKSDEDQ